MLKNPERNRSGSVEAPSFFLCAFWFGMFAGLTEAGLLGVARFGLHRSVDVGWNVVWMAPLADSLLLCPLALCFALVSRIWPGNVSLRVPVLTFSMLGFVSILFMYKRLHLSAVLILAAGLAGQTSRFISKHPAGFKSIVRRTVAPLAGLILLIALTLHGWLWFAEERGRAGLPAASPNAPNVLLIVLDTVRSENLSLYGYNRSTTPNLERLAANGIVFDHATSTAPWTLTSHATMFTGRYPFELSADWKSPLDGTYPTLAESLTANGYLTAGFVANTDVCSYEGGLNRGFAHYEDYGVSPGEILRSSTLGRVITSNLWLRHVSGYYEIPGRKTAEDVNRHFLDWLTPPTTKPFFVFLNYFDAHGPYLPPKKFAEKFTPGIPRSERYPALGWRWTDAEIQGEIYAYDGAIAYLDHQLGLLFDELKKRNLFDNTLIVVTADHGEEFGEHGLFSHGNSLYLRSTHVPLIMSFPSRIPAGKTIHERVTLRDLASTIIDITNPPNGSRFPGNPLSRFWSDSAAPTSSISPVLSEVNFAKNLPEWFPVSKGDMKGLIADNWHYIKNGDGREELYDLANDGQEMRNLASSPQALPIAEQFRRSMKSILPVASTANKAP